jgi:hypothetical protein
MKKFNSQDLEKLKRKEKKKGKELSNQFNKQLESNNHSNMSLPGLLRLRSSCNKNLCSFVNYKKGCTRLAAAGDKVYQLLVHGRWFSPGTPTSSTIKTGRHHIAEILLKEA